MKNLVPVNEQIIEILSRDTSSDIFSNLDEKYKFEPRGNFQNTASYIAKPRNTFQVSKIMNQANTIGFGVVAFSGGSGLVCGQI